MPQQTSVANCWNSAILSSRRMPECGLLDTRAWEAPDPARAYRAGDHYDLAGRSLAVLRLRPKPRP